MITAPAIFFDVMQIGSLELHDGASTMELFGQNI